MLLTLTMCLHLSSTACLFPQFPLDHSAQLPFHCARAAQQLAVEWLQRHPGYVLRRAECKPAAKAKLNI
jgi:hypothetical protein